MDLAPYLIARGRWGYRMGDGQLYDSMLRDGLNDAFSGRAFGLAHRRSGPRIPDHARGAGPLGAALAAALRGRAGGRASSSSEIVPVEVPGAKGPTCFDKDEHNRPDTTLETLAKLQAGVPQGRHHHRRQCARA